MRFQIAMTTSDTVYFATIIPRSFYDKNSVVAMTIIPKVEGFGFHGDSDFAGIRFMGVRFS